MVTPELVDPLDANQVPPCGPGMETASPSDWELFFKGHLEVPVCCPGGGTSGSPQRPCVAPPRGNGDPTPAPGPNGGTPPTDRTTATPVPIRTIPTTPTRPKGAIRNRPSSVLSAMTLFPSSGPGRRICYLYEGRVCAPLAVEFTQHCHASITDSMSNVLRLAIVDPDDSKREALKNMLLGMDMIWLEAECSRYEFFSDVVAQTNPDIGMIALDADPTKALALVSRLSETSPKCAVLVVSSSNDGQLILQAMRAGRRSFSPSRSTSRTCWARWGGSASAISLPAKPGPAAARSLPSPAPSAAWAPPAWPSTSAASSPRKSGTPSPWSISISASATPTCSSTPSPTTPWSTSPKTSPGSISPS